MLLTVAVLGILAAVLIPQLTSDLPDRLDAAAQVVAFDLDYARSLAVANNSKYRVTFDPVANSFCLQHSGTNNLLNVLPRSPFRRASDAPDRQTTDLSELPLPEPSVRLVGAVRMEGPGVAATHVQFVALGNTSFDGTNADTADTVVWLACGSGTSARYISVHVHHVTGLTDIGPVQSSLPASVIAALADETAD
jgi:hypothetical protein